jgi:hypothetical protein
MFAKVYLHSSKDEMYAIGEKIGLKGKSLENFMYACYEVEIELKVDKDGNSEITSVDGKSVLLV